MSRYHLLLSSAQIKLIRKDGDANGLRDQLNDEDWEPDAEDLMGGVWDAKEREHNSIIRMLMSQDYFVARQVYPQASRFYVIVKLVMWSEYLRD